MEEYFFMKTDKCPEPTWILPCNINFDLKTANLVLDKINDNIKVDIIINKQYICSLSKDDFIKVNDKYVYEFKNWGGYIRQLINFIYLSIVSNCACIPKLEYYYTPLTIYDEVKRMGLRYDGCEDEIHYKNLIIYLTPKGTARVLKQN
jgi:hypothetical protein